MSIPLLKRATPHQLARLFPVKRATVDFRRAIISGESCSGKTSLFRFLYNTYLKFQFTHIIVVSSTVFGPDYDFLVPVSPSQRITKVLEISNELINTVMNFNNGRIARRQKPYPILFVFDDSGSQYKYMDSMRSLFTRGRHSHCESWYLTQAIKSQIHWDVRDNIDILISFRNSNVKLTDYLIDTFLRVIEVPDEYLLNPTAREQLNWWKAFIKENQTEYVALIVDTGPRTKKNFKAVSIFRLPKRLAL